MNIRQLMICVTRWLAVLCACFALNLASPTAAEAASGHPGPLGIGVILGYPTGLSAKYRMSSREAVDFGLAYAFDNFVLVFSDYLYHFPGAFGANSKFATELTPYVGVGGAFYSGSLHRRNEAGLGLRIPLGVEWRPSYPPIGVFVELAPGIGLIPSTFGFINGGIGVRFYF